MLTEMWHLRTPAWWRRRHLGTELGPKSLPIAGDLESFAAVLVDERSLS